MLRANQKLAIDKTNINNFDSGIHFHATGTGKSWIAMNILKEFNKRFPTKNVIWICEKKSILIEQFDKQTISSRDFNDIMRQFLVLNYTTNKDSNWHKSVNNIKFWNKPYLLIINRAFLTSKEKYEKIREDIGLIIHDECHSIINKSTQRFYEFILKSEAPPKCIGFSATPHLGIKPFDKIISSYSIYDAFLDKTILPPKITWFTSTDILTDIDLIKCIKSLILDPKLIYKKLVIWCGMIDLCLNMANLWSQHFQEFKIFIDTSKEFSQFKGYSEFEQEENNALLFCACKHREGSDIHNLDGCIFLDKVESRCPKLFVQSIGRVLRLDKSKKKTYGLVIDVKIKNTNLVCSNINNYLSIDQSIFPWKYEYNTIICNKKLVKINTLVMVKNNFNNISNNFIIKNHYIDHDITSKFIREIPNKDEYKIRLKFELDMISNKNLISYLIQAINILDFTKELPHVTRGSCGSSLVCYLLGISHIDPVKHKIKFARFLTNYRDNLPDIDIDFPHNMREEVFFKIEQMWPGKIARISNHVFYHEKSALRQAIRNEGIHKFIGKNDINKELSKLNPLTRKKILNETKKLKETFRCYSLHCGGIVYYPNNVPEHLILKSNNNNKILKQITLNKHEIAKDKNFKIDILSSRAVSQLYAACNFTTICFDKCTFNKKTYDMLGNGDNIGITLAESPLMRKAFIKIKPNSIKEIAICLALIRPAALNSKYDNNSENLTSDIIFDDDAIEFISKKFNICDEKADYFRRGFSKHDKKIIDEFKLLLNDFSKDEKKKILSDLSSLSKYGFCKSHAFSYAQLVYKLAFMKCNSPYQFWKATLNNCQSSYRKWVHLYQAKLAGIEVTKNILKKDDVSIYAQNRRKKITEYDCHEQLRRYGYWLMENDKFFPGCFIKRDKIVSFNGIIASIKIKSKSKKDKIALIFLGVEKNVYVQLNISNIKYIDHTKIGISGEGKFTSQLDAECSIITVNKYNFY